MIPARYQQARYEDVPEKIRTKFEKIRETRKGLYIHGSVGTGKTHIAYALKKKWDEEHEYKRAVFWNTTELLHEIREDFGRGQYDKVRPVEELMESGSQRLLFLDDIGAERATDWVAETFYLLINDRYERMMPVVFTSNLSIKELGEALGDRIASRIVEMSDVVELTGEDKRLS